MSIHPLRQFFLRAVSLAIGVLLLLCASRLPPPAWAAEPGWVSLFNGRDLEGWYTYFNGAGKNHDPKKVFKVEGGVLHVLDIPVTGENEENGYIATEKEFTNSRIYVEYRWGTKRYAPHADRPRDAGLLYWLVGPDHVWPLTIECQIQENDTGDTWLLGGASTTTTVSDKQHPQYKEGGDPYTQNKGRIIKSANFEKPGWNTVEVIMQGESFTHIVNGHVVNRGWHTTQPDPEHPGGVIPLSSGHIALQAEGAEVFYRNIRVKEIRP